MIFLPETKTYLEKLRAWASGYPVGTVVFVIATVEFASGNEMVVLAPPLISA